MFDQRRAKGLSSPRNRRRNKDRKAAARTFRRTARPVRPGPNSRCSPTEVETRSHLYELLHSAPVVLWAADRNANFTFIEGQSLQARGRKPEEFVGHSIHELVDDVSEVKTLWERVMSGDELTVLLRRRDGGYIETRVAPMRRAGGPVEGAVGVAIDVTERVEARRALAISERNYRELVESVNSIILRCDRQGRITFMNGYGLQFFGYSEREVLGKQVQMLLPATDSYGRDTSRLMQEILAHPEDYALNENENMRKNGRRAWVAWSNRPLRDESGQIGGLLCVGRDFTAQKQADEAVRRSEERFRRIVETAREGIWITDPALRITFVNERTAEMLGFDTAEMIGKSILDFVDPSWQETARATFEKGRHALSEQHDVKLRRKDGGEVWVIMSCGPLRDEHGAYLGHLAMLTDVTERRKLELEVLSATELERKRIGQDLHDALAQQLAGLVLISKLMSNRLSRGDTVSKAEVDKLAGAAGEAAATARSLASGLIPTEVTGSGFIESLQELARQTSELYGVPCRFESEGALVLPNTVAQQIYNIALEAVSNAVRHSQGSFILISVRSEQDTILLCIEDNGVGVQRPSGGRSGLGMRTMRHRAQIIGARLVVAARPGGGTMVTCAVPLGEHQA